MLERPWTSDPDKFHFAILGDRRGGADSEWPVFDRAVDEINVLRPDFVIMVGDMIEGNTQSAAEVAAEWDDFWRHAGRLEVPLLLLPGNHDISNPDMLRWWQEHIGLTHYSFLYKGCYFLTISCYDLWAEGGSSIGDEQVRFALDALEEHKAARHTFVFVHPPLWQENVHHWQQIEAALGDRPYTVFAGHTHRLAYEERNGARYVVLGTTKGERVREENRFPELGGFPHFTQVVVDGDSVHVAIIEPGGIWPEDIATRTLQQELQDFFTVETHMPEGLDTPSTTAGFAFTVNNPLPEKAEVALDIVGPGAANWRPLDGQSAYAFTVPPGARKAIDLRFAAATADILPVPRLRCRATYKDVNLLGFERNVYLFPDEALRWAPDWMVVGPYEAGPLPSRTPENPRDTMPDLYVPHVPEKGYDGGAAIIEDGRTMAWQKLSAQPEYGLGFVNVGKVYGVPSEDFAYALSAVQSPKQQIVYARFRVDDYGQIFVNGEPFEERRLFRTRRDPTWVAIPLEAGWNTVVVKSIAIAGGWSFRLLFADPDYELQFAPYPSE